MMRERLCLTVFLLLVGAAGAAAGMKEMQLSMEALEGEGWRGRELVVEVADIGNGGFSLALNLARLVVGDSAFEDIHLGCAVVLPGDSPALNCGDGELVVAASPLGKLSARVSWSYLGAGDWKLSLDLLEIPGGKLKIHASRQSKLLLADIEASRFPLAWLQPWLPEGWSLGGTLQGKGTIRVEGQEPSSIAFAGSLDGFSWSSADGLQVGEDISLAFSVKTSGDASQWRGALEAGISSGQLYSDPLFLEAGGNAFLELATGFDLFRDRQQLLLRGLRLSYARALEVRGDLDMDLASGQPRALDLDFVLEDLRQTYQVLLQPLVIGTPLDDLVVQGRASGNVRMTGGVLTGLTMNMDRLRAEHNGGMFGVNDVQASLNWRHEGVADFSHLSWKSAHLYRIGLGATEALFKASGGSLRLQPLRIPLLGGRLMLHDLEMTGLLDGGGLAWETRADLDDIQLAELSRAMGWPDMQGRLQATIPRIHYRDAVLRMEGELQLDVFGGEVVVEGLELQEPLGVAPVLQTNLRFANLDLEQITQVFSFGRIEGSLEGQVHDLQLVGWEVAAFDASLHSPARDRRPHRISQRAIDNLTELGNGASVQLSATMLRFFEDFAYDSLALKVKLRGTTAELDGVPRPQGGYYIVKGARLPRIDVIGRNHRIAWKELLSRIRDIRFDDMIVE